MPIISKINDPDIPGSISPQTARAPATKIKNIPSGSCEGGINVSEKVIPTPSRKVIASVIFHFRISRKTSGAEIRISPKKNDQIRMA